MTLKRSSLVLISSSLLIGCGGGKEETASCPGGYISIGGGYCREVKCSDNVIHPSKLNAYHKQTFKDGGYKCSGYRPIPIFSGQPIPASK